MKKEKKEETREDPEVSRRDFVKATAGAAVGALVGAAVGAAGVGAATVKTVEVPKIVEKEVVKTVEVPKIVEKEVRVELKPWLPEKWDYEADVVVIGTGFAGQAAAIEADKAGASVIILEKAPFKHRGGNSRVCGQGFLSPSKAIWEDYFLYLKALTTGLGFPVPDEHLRLYTEESSKNVKWFEDMGATVVPDTRFPGMKSTYIPFYPQMPGADAIATEPGYYSLGGKYTGPGRDWYFLEDYIKGRKGIKIMYETPAKRLIQDIRTKEILGVVAESGGKEIYVKAKRAVCVCGGGYEYNQEMIRDFQGISANYSPGSPYNTGETIKMCWAVGADIRNMSVRAAPSRLSAGVLPGYPSALRVSSTPKKGGLIMVGANNKRFRDEYRAEKRGIPNRGINTLERATNATGQIIENGVYVRDKFPMPMHLIFNEEARLSGPLFGGAFAEQVDGFVCSPDNSAELARGWIIKANSIRELALKIGRDPDALEATVKRWNECCAAGRDLDFDTGDPTIVPYDRPKECLVPIPLSGAPVYAVQCFPECLNTQGGMRRNTNSQVLDIWGKAIPRLYSAGENGDIWTIVYQCMSNVGGGCFGYGRIAGKNAAAEKPWA